MRVNGVNVGHFSLGANVGATTITVVPVSKGDVIEVWSHNGRTTTELRNTYYDRNNTCWGTGDKGLEGAYYAPAK